MLYHADQLKKRKCSILLCSYMAPEILNHQIHEDYKDGNFKSVLLADVYAMALTFWEIIQRVEDKSNNFFNTLC